MKRRTEINFVLAFFLFVIPLSHPLTICFAPQALNLNFTETPNSQSSCRPGWNTAWQSDAPKLMENKIVFFRLYHGAWKNYLTPWAAQLLGKSALVPREMFSSCCWPLLELNVFLALSVVNIWWQVLLTAFRCYGLRGRSSSEQMLNL